MNPENIINHGGHGEGERAFRLNSLALWAKWRNDATDQVFPVSSVSPVVKKTFLA